MPKFAKIRRSVTELWRGRKPYQKTLETPQASYLALRDLFCATNGWSNDLLHAVVRRRWPAVPLREARGALGNLSPADVAQTTAALDRDGCYVFSHKLPEDLCHGLQ